MKVYIIFFKNIKFLFYVIFFSGKQSPAKLLPYKRGPTATYMAHIEQMSGRRMLQDVINRNTII